MEWERRFLLRAMPPGEITREVTIVDRYIRGTRIRLRTMTGAEVVHKLTQKIPSVSGGPGTLTTMYLSEREHACFAALPANVIEKTRYSIPPFGIDVFRVPIAGMVLAEAEFEGEEEMRRMEIPTWAIAEVTDDPRFAGGTIAMSTAGEIDAVLRTFGVRMDGG